jgi:hypothetical protein
LGAFNVSSVSHKQGFFQLRVLLLGTRNQVVLARAIRLGHLQWAEREERPPSRLASGELVAPAGSSDTLHFIVAASLGVLDLEPGPLRPVPYS